MHAPLGDYLAIEVSELFDQPDVLEECRAAAAGCKDVEVVADRRAGCMGQKRLLVDHDRILPGQLAVRRKAAQQVEVGEWVSRATASSG
jgi:hypothetical protein